MAHIVRLGVGLALGLLWASSAQALEPRYSDTGQPVKWAVRDISFTLDDSLKKVGDKGGEATSEAFKTWSGATDGVPRMSTTTGKKKAPGFLEAGPNENVVVYSAEKYPPAKGALAVTLLTYDTASGRILDADIVVNGADHKWGVLELKGDEVKTKSDKKPNGKADETPRAKTFAANLEAASKGVFDLQNVMSHEVGHTLGLPEDYKELDATMYASSPPGETKKRWLFTTDTEAVVKSYAFAVEAVSEGTDGSQQPGGCGGAEVAKGWTSHLSWRVHASLLALAMALGFALLRLRPRLGTAMAGSAGLAAGWLLMVPPFLGDIGTASASSVSKIRPDADITVLSAHSRWVDGVIVTKLSGRVDACYAAFCPQGALDMDVYGGRFGTVTQVVGTDEVPDVGMGLAVKLAGARSWVEVLRPLSGR